MALSNIVNPLVLNKYVAFWLEEDVGHFDISSIAVGSKEVSAAILMNESGVLAGLPFIEAVFKKLHCEVQWNCSEGEFVNKGTIVAVIRGLSNKMLMAERTALNLLSRACGVATVSRRVQESIASKWKGQVAGTRKTSPGMRIVEKYAMYVGGITTHRYDLSAMVMLKDNHIKVNGSIEESVKVVKEKVGKLMMVEVECHSAKEALEAAKFNVDVIMLDNFEAKEVKSLSTQVKSINPSVLIEVSGGINENNILEYAVDNVDIISSSIFCQGYKCIDFSLNIVSDIEAFVPEIIHTVNDTSTAAIDVEVIDVELFDKTNESAEPDFEVAMSPKAGNKRKIDETPEKSVEIKAKVTPAETPKGDIKKTDEKFSRLNKPRGRNEKPANKTPRLSNSFPSNGRPNNSNNSSLNNSGSMTQLYQQPSSQAHIKAGGLARMPGHPVSASTPRGGGAGGPMNMMRAMAGLTGSMAFPPAAGNHQPSDAFFTGAAPMRYGGTPSGGQRAMATLTPQGPPQRPLMGGPGLARYFCRGCNFQNQVNGPPVCRMCRSMLF